MAASSGMKMAMVILTYVSFCILWSPLLTGAETTYYVSLLGRASDTIVGQTNPLVLLFNNQNPTAINITISGSNCNKVGQHTIDQTTSNEMLPIDMACSGLIPTGIEIASKGLQISSPSDFMLQVIQIDESLPSTSREGYLAFEKQHLGNEYYVVTYCHTGGWCQFSVLATEDTSLNIRFPRYVSANATCVTSSGSTSTVSAGTSVPFSLSALDILHIESQQDLSGTYISSDKIVAVFAGARNVPSTNENRTSHFMEQMLPINKWGKEFIAIPNDLNENGDLINIVSKSDNTTVENLGFSTFVMPNAGDSIIRRIDWGMPAYIRTDKPVTIAQFMFINLYNNGDREERPSMVLVQARNQWADVNYFNAHIGFPNTGILIAAASSSSLKWEGISPPVNAVDFFSTSDTIERSGDAKFGFQTKPGFSKIKDGPAGGYGFYTNNIAMLGNIVSVDNEDCRVMFGRPGDRIDNDCDDKVDEDECSESDLETTFYLPYDVTNYTAPIFTQAVEIGATNKIRFKVITCGLLQISLRSSTQTTKFAAIQVSQKYILLESCSPNCNVDAEVQVANIDDCTVDEIEFTLELGNSMKVTPATGNSATVTTSGYNLDRLLLMSLVRESNVTLGITDKDCRKMIIEDEDNYGLEFIIPLLDSGSTAVTDFCLFITNKGSDDATIVEYSLENTFTTRNVPSNSSITIKKSDMTIYNGYNFVRLRSSVEVSVHFMYHTNGDHTTALMLLPVDILGPWYHYYLKDGGSNKNMFIPAVEDQAVLLKEDMSTIVNENQLQSNQIRERETLIEAHTPFALFTGYKRIRFAQIPPKEYLGKTFNIPPIALDELQATATITVITTEDSTYMRILGDYHQQYTLEYKGNIVERDLTNDQLFEIISVKPVQVMLEITATSGKWGSMLIIPHVEQYVSVTVFPTLPTAEFSIRYSSGVKNDVNKSTFTPIVAGPTLPDSQRFLAFDGEPFYFLTFVNDTSSGRLFVLTSDLKFDTNSNQLCVLTPGTPGDDLDNDCDILVNEETCDVATIQPGEIDPDIDGSLFEDCAANSNPPTNNEPLLALSTNTTTCPPATSVPTASPPTPGPTFQPTVIHNKLSADWYSNLQYPPLPPQSAPPTFEPIESTGTVTTPAPSTTVGTASPGTTASTTAGTTTVAEETCTTDCVCPCGWVQEKNYTEEELGLIIANYQQQLKVQKNKLSSVLRKKTSAPDNRPSATAVGYVGFTFLIITIGAITLLDVTSIIRDLRMLRSNLQEVFNI